MIPGDKKKKRKEKIDEILYFFKPLERRLYHLD